jgi:hypothetical protein
MAAEADSLARTSFGPTMLRAIGRCYISQVPCSCPLWGFGNLIQAMVCKPKEPTMFACVVTGKFIAHAGGDPPGQLL